MANTQYYYRTLVGSDENDTLIANFAAVDALHYTETFWANSKKIENVFSWNRKIAGLEGNDVVIRDRPGDYKADAAMSENPIGGDVHVFGDLSWGPTQNQTGGQDTISYQHYAGGIEIKLDTGGGEGFARAFGSSPVTIFGDDILHSFEHAIGTDQADRITGTNGANRLRGLDGNDRIWAEDGADTVEGGDGADTLHGGEGHDRLYGQDGNDKLFGDGGNDTLWGGSGVNELYGGSGNDVLWVEGSGGKGFGQGGNDIVSGGSGADYLDGGSGNDILVGNAGNDTIKGDVGHDTIDGGAGIDTAVWSGSQAVVLTLNNSGNGTATQGGYTDTLLSIERVVSGSGNDVITLGSQANRVEAGEGADTVDAGSGNDTVLGAGGDDWLEGGFGNDNLSGGNGRDTMFGEHGNDVLNGGGGNDLLYGGQGADTMTGGSGKDGFIWNEGDWGTDIITDFVIGRDWLGINDFLADPVGNGESYVGKVFAFMAENGNSTVLTAQSTGGWQPFVILRGHDDPNVVWEAIQNGTLFSATPLNGGAPGGFDF